MPNDYTYIENQAALKALQDLEKKLLDEKLEGYIVSDNVLEIIKLEKEQYDTTR